MSTATPLPRPSVTTLFSSCFTYTKETVTSCVQRIQEKRAEHMQFAKDPTNIRKSKSTELTDFGTFEKGEEEEEFDEFGLGAGERITDWQAGWNVTNAIQGMFLVSLPYAVLHGGYWALLAMIGVAYICCYTGKILVDCLYEEDSNGLRTRVRDSYMAIAKVGFGERFGPAIVSTAQLIELLMTCILYIVLCGDLMVGTFYDSPIDSRSWMMLCGMILLPCAFLKNLHSVSTLSFWCTIAHVLINLIVVAYCLASIGQWGFSEVTFTLDFETFPISLGIIVFSYTSHIFLPTLEGNMQEPEKFGKMLDWSHVAAAVFKSGFGYIGFLTWRKSTMSVITNNLPTFWKSLVNFILVLKAILSYPLPYYAAADLLEKIFFLPKGETKTDSSKKIQIYDKEKDLTTLGCTFRVGLVFFTILMAVMIPHFSILMGFIGNFTGTMLSFIWPCYFHLKLKGDGLPLKSVVVDCFIIFLGVAFGVVGIYDSGEALVEAYQIGLPF